jgi:hypothetical protein
MFVVLPRVKVGGVGLVVRALLGVGILLGAFLIPFEAVGVGLHIHGGGGSPGRSEQHLLRAYQLDPVVLDRLSTDLPRTARYDVEIGPALGRTDRGQAFADIVRTSLLPRLEVGSAETVWHIRWGASAGTAGCAQVIHVGRLNPSDPPVYVCRNG